MKKRETQSDIKKAINDLKKAAEKIQAPNQSMSDSAPAAGWIYENDWFKTPSLKETEESKQVVGFKRLQKLAADMKALDELAMQDAQIEELKKKVFAEKRAAEVLEHLAMQDAQKDIAKHYANEDAKEMADDVWSDEPAYATRKQPAKPGRPKKIIDNDAKVVWNPSFSSYVPVEKPNKGEFIDHSISENQIVDKLNKLEEKLNSLDANWNKIIQEVKASPQAPKHNSNVGFLESDLHDLEKILDDLESRSKQKTNPAIMQGSPSHNSKLEFDKQYSPSKLDVEKLITTLEDMGAKVIASNHSPAVTPNDLHSYLEKEAIMAKTKSGWVTEPDGTSKHYKNGILHADGDNPAEMRLNGTQLYYKNGSLHRDGNLPAMVGARGTTKFAVDGKYHRVGGLPAVTWSKGPYRTEYWINGEIQRAVKKDGTEEWYAPGCVDRDEALFSRLDGPAVIHPNKREEFWINGNLYATREQWITALSRLNSLKEEALDRELIDEDPIDSIADDEVSETITELQTKASKGKKKKMEKLSFTETLKANAVSAGFRVAGTQLTSAVKGAILTVMRNKGADGGAIQAFSAFLDTEFGAAMISFMIGSGLPYVPHYGDTPSVMRLATEMQVGGMATAGNAIIGEAMQHVLPAITQILQNLPAVEDETTSNVRVIESKSESKLAESLMEEEGDEEVDATETASKTMKA